MFESTKPSNQHLTNMSIIQIPSIFLPRVSHYNDEAYIENVFRAFLGTTNSPIDHIDMVMKEDTRNGQLYYIAFVFFVPLGESQWDTNSVPDWLNSFAQDIENGSRINIIHSHPWFCNVSKNTGKKQTFSRPRIMSEQDEESIKAAQREIIANRTTSKGQAVVEAYDAAITAAKDVVAGWNNYGVKTDGAESVENTNAGGSAAAAASSEE